MAKAPNVLRGGCDIDSKTVIIAIQTMNHHLYICLICLDQPAFLLPLICIAKWVESSAAQPFDVAGAAAGGGTGTLHLLGTYLLIIAPHWGLGAHILTRLTCAHSHSLSECSW